MHLLSYQILKSTALKKVFNIPEPPPVDKADQMQIPNPWEAIKRHVDKQKTNFGSRGIEVVDGSDGVAEVVAPTKVSSPAAEQKIQKIGDVKSFGQNPRHLKNRKKRSN
jgi:hypothetical protein